MDVDSSALIKFQITAAADILTPIMQIWSYHCSANTKSLIPRTCEIINVCCYFDSLSSEAICYETKDEEFSFKIMFYLYFILEKLHV